MASPALDIRRDCESGKVLSGNIISFKNGEVMEGKPCFTWAGKNYKAGGISFKPLTCGRESGALGRTDLRLVLLIENVEL